MKFQIDVTPDGQVIYEVIERDRTENCTKTAHQLVQGMSIESDEKTGPDCDEVHEHVSTY